MLMTGATKFFLSEKELGVILSALRACVKVTTKTDVRIVLNDVVIRLETTRRIRDEDAIEKSRIRQRAYTKRKRMKLRELETVLDAKSDGEYNGVGIRTRNNGV